MTASRYSFGGRRSAYHGTNLRDDRRGRPAFPQAISFAVHALACISVYPRRQ